MSIDLTYDTIGKCIMGEEIKSNNDKLVSAIENSSGGSSSNLEEEVESLKTNVNTNTTDIESIKSSIETLNTNVSTNTTNISTANKNITNLQSGFTSMSKKLKAVQNTVSKLSTDISTNTSSINDIKSKMATTDQFNNLFNMFFNPVEVELTEDGDEFYIKISDILNLFSYIYKIVIIARDPDYDLSFCVDLDVSAMEREKLLGNIIQTQAIQPFSDAFETFTVRAVHFNSDYRICIQKIYSLLNHSVISNGIYSCLVYGINF